MSTKYYLDWKEVDSWWIETDYIWKDVYILIGEITGGGALLGGDHTLGIDPLNPWESMEKKLKKRRIEQEKIDKFLEVIVSVKGQKKTFKKELKDDPKITIDDIQKTFNKYGHSHIKVKAEIKK